MTAIRSLSVVALPLILGFGGAAIADESVQGVSSASPPAATSTTYTPGLGEIMSAIQLRHAKLWFAGKGENWELAAYELSELQEAFENAAQYQPEFHGKPIAKLIEPMTVRPIEHLQKAIAARDRVSFIKAYDKLSNACSSCHQSTEHGFIIIQRPKFPPLSNQRYDAKDH